MTWALRYNDDRNIVELTYSGLVSPTELKDSANAAFSLAKANDTSKFLADCTDMIGGHSVVDLYFLITHFEESGITSLQEALLLPALQSPREEVDFYETACLNRGFNVKIFSDEREALDWLAD